MISNDVESGVGPAWYFVNRTDSQAAELVRNAAPPHVFSRIMVATVDHPFFGKDELIRARKITFERTDKDVAWEAIRAFFLHVFKRTNKIQALY
ncbi:hypothetical protein DB41_FQ00090, partial [Neochlamydia sp. TUME1]|uniref:hypothetical protein n=1 Tax=Neochlamydia sp. TUME1 TaxID=1478174 RepID=UPI00057EEEA4